MHTKREFQIKTLRNTFGRMDKMSIESYEKLADILDKADMETLIALRDANIKFVSKLAINRLVRAA